MSDHTRNSPPWLKAVYAALATIVLLTVISQFTHH